MRGVVELVEDTEWAHEPKRGRVVQTTEAGEFCCGVMFSKGIPRAEVADGKVEVHVFFGYFGAEGGAPPRTMRIARGDVGCELMLV